MALENLLNLEQQSVITDDDRIMHTTKMVERTLGVSVADLGTVEIRDGQAVLVFSYKGTPHTMRWERQSSGAIFWFLDNSDHKLILGESGRAFQRLRAALDQ